MGACCPLAVFPATHAGRGYRGPAGAGLAGAARPAAVYEPALRVVPGRPAAGGSTAFQVLVRVEPPDCMAPTPSDIVCVIDTSTSMGDEAVMRDVSGQREAHGFSLLDIAKHGLRTVIHTLGPNDRLAIVSFHAVANVVLPLTRMNARGRRLAQRSLDRLVADGGTILWSGLEKGLDVCRAGAGDAAWLCRSPWSPPRLAHLMLLTDGMTVWREEVIPNLKDYARKCGGVPCTVNTFGFGCQIDSPLLAELAHECSGTFSFIPDPGFVGTVFVNTISNLLTTMARDAYLTVEAQAGARIVQVVGLPDAVESSGDARVRVKLGTLQIGQPRDVTLQMAAGAAPGPPGVVARLEYAGPGRMRCVAAAAGSGEGGGGEGPPGGGPPEAHLRDLEVQLWRGAFVGLLARVLPAMQCSIGYCGMPVPDSTQQAALQAAKDLAEGIAASSCAEHAHAIALLSDVQGQVLEALSQKSALSRWGIHYLHSLLCAHWAQQCNNFKDPGVQVYGGELFHRLQDVADDIFNNLPAPTPSRGNVLKAELPAAGRRWTAPLLSMASYNNPAVLCIEGASLAQLADGTLVRVDGLCKGDRVAGPCGAAATVVCVVQTKCHAGWAELVEVADCAWVTPHHPVLVEGAWRLPASLACPRLVRPCRAVFSFVLAGAPALLVGGVPCIALGHGLKEGAARHPYFGTQHVLEDLARLPGFGTGLVEMGEGTVAMRDSRTGLVCGLS